MKSRLLLFQEESLKTGLAQEERSEIRNSLMAYIDRNPIKESKSFTQTFLSFFSTYTRRGIGALFIVLFVSSIIVAMNGTEKVKTLLRQARANILPAFQSSSNLDINSNQ